ncbi:hypothetical protein RI367_001227 [Sorochytrium milnesiophthora]
MQMVTQQVSSPPAIPLHYDDNYNLLPAAPHIANGDRQLQTGRLVDMANHMSTFLSDLRPHSVAHLEHDPTMTTYSILAMRLRHTLQRMEAFCAPPDADAAVATSTDGSPHLPANYVNTALPQRRRTVSADMGASHRMRAPSPPTAATLSRRRVSATSSSSSSTHPHAYHPYHPKSAPSSPSALPTSAESVSSASTSRRPSVSFA